MIEPLRFSFEVKCSAAHAFATWTERATAWFPVAHPVSREPGLHVVFEPRSSAEQRRVLLQGGRRGVRTALFWARTPCARAVPPPPWKNRW